jgi:hypothetical protein
MPRIDRWKKSCSTLKVGRPPNWENVPDEFKPDLAALDRLEDEAL